MWNGIKRTVPGASVRMPSLPNLTDELAGSPAKGSFHHRHHGAKTGRGTSRICNVRPTVAWGLH